MRHLIKAAVGSVPRLDDSLEKSIEKAIGIQLRHGLDIVTDGEQRTDMIGYFEQIPGLTQSDGKVGVTGRIRQPIHVEELHKLKDFSFARKCLRDKGVQDVGLKAEVTGPTTLGFTCATTKLKGYRSIVDLELYRDLASALRPLIDELLRLDAYVQIDEPGVSAKFLDPVHSVTLINEIVKDLKHFDRGKGKLSVHVCGDITKTAGLFGLLTELDVDILSLAFGGRVEGRNLELLSDEKFRKSGKRLGFGCLSATSPTTDSVEPVQEVVELLNKGIRKVGFEKLAYVHPNCGLRNTPLDVTEEIFSRMKVSVEQIK